MSEQRPTVDDLRTAYFEEKREGYPISTDRLREAVARIIGGPVEPRVWSKILNRLLVVDPQAFFVRHNGSIYITIGKIQNPWLG